MPGRRKFRNQIQAFDDRMKDLGLLQNLELSGDELGIVSTLPGRIESNALVIRFHFNGDAGKILPGKEIGHHSRRDHDRS